MTTSLAADLAKAIRTECKLSEWAADPVLYCREALSVILTDAQEAMIRALVTSKRVATKSGHKTGKTKCVACVAIWWADVMHGRVILTSSGGRQVGKILWTEIRALWEHAKKKGTLPWTVPVPAKTPAHGMRWHDGSEILGFSTDKPEAMAGFSHPRMLYLVDEASGVDEGLFGAIEGNLAASGSIMLTSNPTQLSGYFYDAFHDKADIWTRFTLSSRETPNYKFGRVVVPGLATREWCDERLREWGPDSPLYLVRVLGQFPPATTDNIVPVHLVEAARKRYDELEDPAGVAGELHIGVDVARYGDDESVLQPRRGQVVLPCRRMSGRDTVAVSSEVLALAADLRRGGEQVLVKVDEIGIGAGVCDLLKSMAREHTWLEVFGVNVAERAVDEENYALLRDQLWFAGRDFLRAGGMLAPNKYQEHELVAAKYRFDTRGRHKVESKDDMKKRLRRSPNDADALHLAIWKPRAGYRGALPEVHTYESPVGGL